MDPAELKAFLEKGENLHTEFKQWPPRPDDLAPSIVAFANTDGGQILVGIDNQRRVVGLEASELDRATQLVDNVAFQNCEPPVTVLQETVRDEQGRTVLAVRVPKGGHRPYRTNRGVYYIRISSGRRQASREELLRLFQAAESLYYDETPILQATTADLDEQAITDLLQVIREHGLDLSGIARDRLLENWRLVRPTNGQIRPTLAGILFLSRSPQQFLPAAYVSAVSILGNDLSLEPLDHKRIEGRLIDMLQGVMKFLYLYLKETHVIHELESEIRPELPPTVLREALVNAVAHRDYTVSAPVRVIVFRDRLEIRTPGGLPNNVAIESLRAGVHVLRNPGIYNILLKTGLVTDAGSGIPRMIRAMRESAGREPGFHLEGGEFIVTLPRSPDSGIHG